jgi:hypothetical protein
MAENVAKLVASTVSWLCNASSWIDVAGVHVLISVGISTVPKQVLKIALAVFLYLYVPVVSWRQLGKRPLVPETTLKSFLDSIFGSHTLEPFWRPSQIRERCLIQEIRVYRRLMTFARMATGCETKVSGYPAQKTNGSFSVGESSARKEKKWER